MGARGENEDYQVRENLDEDDNVYEDAGWGRTHSCSRAR